jgi:hypothetical protein
MFGCDLCRIRWEKHPRAFVQAVEGCEIYNFPIHHSVHFSWNILRKTQSNRGTLKRFRVGARPRAALRAHPCRATRAPAPPASASGLTGRFPRLRLSRLHVFPCTRTHWGVLESPLPRVVLPLIGRPPVVYRWSLRCPGPVRDTYKRGDRPLYACRADLEPLRPSPLARPRRTPPCAPSRRRTTTLSFSLDHIDAPCRTLPNLTSSSSEFPRRCGSSRRALPSSLAGH